MENPIIPRIGTFLILVGLGLLFLFIVSMLGKESHYEYLLFSAISLILGGQFRHRAPRPESSRFAAIRRAGQRSRQRREDKLSKEDQKK